MDVPTRTQISTLVGRSLDFLPWLILLGVAAGFVLQITDGVEASLLMLVGPAALAVVVALIDRWGRVW